MKRIIKRNQLIITALAALIAVAGYLNYADKNINDKVKEAAAKEAATKETTVNEQTSTEDVDVASKTGDIESNEQDVEKVPGEAIFVNAAGTVDFIVEAKMSKEYIRVTNQEALQKIISDTNISDEEKKTAVDKMVLMTEISEKEIAAENLIMAKGYKDVVVTMTDENVDVIVVANELDAVTRAQIEDIVKRKLEVSADKITINAIQVDDVK